MKNSLISSVIVLSVVSLTASAEEFSWGNVTFQPRVYAGYADYTLKSGDFTITRIPIVPLIQNDEPRPISFDFYGHSKLQFSGLLGGIGGTVATGQFFGDFYYQSTLDESAYSGRSAEDENSSALSDVNAQHADWAISLGYMITDQWSVFAGYKSGNTDWKQKYYVSKGLSKGGWMKFDGKFDQNGSFLGTSYSFAIGNGLLNLKAAYAYLDGNYKRGFSSSGDVFFILEDSPQDINLNGNSNAYSLGISWTQSATDNLGYSIGVNYHSYKFDMSGTASGPKFLEQISGGTLTEDLFTLTASLFYRF